MIDAATRLGRAENRAVFSGFREGGIGGICERSPHAPLELPGEDGDYPGTVAEGIRLLREAGVDGPYGLALGPRAFTAIHRTTGPGGYPVLRAIHDLTGGSVAWAPALDGAVLLSTRGEDFELTLGRDASIGYLGHSASRVELYLVESFAFRVLAPEAAVALRHPA